MVAAYLLCWMPYGVVALVGAFGPGGAVTPLAGTLPAVLAKLSTVVNPVIYVFFNSQVTGGRGRGWVGRVEGGGCNRRMGGCWVAECTVEWTVDGM